MKIAIFHELQFGGARRAVDEFAKRLNNDYTVDLYYIDEKKDDSIKNIYNSVFFCQFKPKVWTGRNWRVRLYKDTIELYKLYQMHKQIAHNIIVGGYDLVFIHPSRFTQAPFLLRFLKVSSIYYCQEPLRIVYDPYFKINKIPFPGSLYEMIVRNIRKRIDKTNIKYALFILANSKYSQQTILNAYNRKSELCYLGVDTERFRPLDINKEYDILFLGTEDPIEGYDLLQEALVNLTFNPVVKVISRKASGQGITDDQLVQEYNKSRIVVALSRNEPFGLIPLEAMACGIPVVALSEGGLQESVVDGITGFLVNPEPKMIADRLRKLLDNNKLRKQMGENAVSYVRLKWTWDESTSRLKEIIDYAT